MTNLKENYFAILDSLSVSVLMLRESGSIIYANSFFEQISGYLSDDLINLDQSVIFEDVIFKDNQNSSIKTKLITKENKYVSVIVYIKDYFLEGEKIKILIMIKMTL